MPSPLVLLLSSRHRHPTVDVLRLEGTRGLTALVCRVITGRKTPAWPESKAQPIAGAAIAFHVAGGYRLGLGAMR